MGWGALVSILGSMMNRESPQIQDVKRKNSVLSNPSTLQNNSGGGGGFASLLANLGGGKKKNKEQDWSSSSDDYWLNNRP